MPFDAASYVMGRKAGGGSGGEQPVLGELTATENGVFTPGEDLDGFDRVVVAIPVYDGSVRLS